MKKQQEKEEELAIVKYNKDKDRAEAERQAEEQRIKDEKEREVQKLREMQEKAADRQADIDALRAKRAFEQGERDARNKERFANEKRARLLKELEEARVRQFMEREQRLAEVAESEKQTFLRILQEQKEAEDREKKIADAKANAYAKHSVNVKA